MTDDQHQRAIELRRQGFTWQRIAETIGVGCAELRREISERRKRDPSDLAVAKELLASARTLEQRRCVIANFGDILARGQ